MTNYGATKSENGLTYYWNGSGWITGAQWRYKDFIPRNDPGVFDEFQWIFPCWGNMYSKECYPKMMWTFFNTEAGSEQFRMWGNSLFRWIWDIIGLALGSVWWFLFDIIAVLGIWFDPSLLPPMYGNDYERITEEQKFWYWLLSMNDELLLTFNPPDYFNTVDGNLALSTENEMPRLWGRLMSTWNHDELQGNFIDGLLQWWEWLWINAFFVPAWMVGLYFIPISAITDWWRPQFRTILSNTGIQKLLDAYSITVFNA